MAQEEVSRFVQVGADALKEILHLIESRMQQSQDSAQNRCMDAMNEYMKKNGFDPNSIEMDVYPTAGMEELRKELSAAGIPFWSASVDNPESKLEGHRSLIMVPSKHKHALLDIMAKLNSKNANQIIENESEIVRQNEMEGGTIMEEYSFRTDDDTAEFFAKEYRDIARDTLGTSNNSILSADGKSIYLSRDALYFNFEGNDRTRFEAKAALFDAIVNSDTFSPEAKAKWIEERTQQANYDKGCLDAIIKTSEAQKYDPNTSAVYLMSKTNTETGNFIEVKDGAVTFYEYNPDFTDPNRSPADPLLHYKAETLNLGNATDEQKMTILATKGNMIDDEVVLCEFDNFKRFHGMSKEQMSLPANQEAFEKVTLSINGMTDRPKFSQSSQEIEDAYRRCQNCIDNVNIRTTDSLIKYEKNPIEGCPDLQVAVPDAENIKRGAFRNNLKEEIKEISMSSVDQELLGTTIQKMGDTKEQFFLKIEGKTTLKIDAEYTAEDIKFVESGYSRKDLRNAKAEKAKLTAIKRLKEASLKELKQNPKKALFKRESLLKDVLPKDKSGLLQFTNLSQTSYEQLVANILADKQNPRKTFQDMMGQFFDATVPQFKEQPESVKTEYIDKCFDSIFVEQLNPESEKEIANLESEIGQIDKEISHVNANIKTINDAIKPAQQEIGQPSQSYQGEELNTPPTPSQE